MANNDPKGRFAAFLIGGLAGFTTGLLLAKRAGAETRLAVADRIDDYQFLAVYYLNCGREALAEQSERFLAAARASARAYRQSARID